jgi:hypothetical protein
VPTGGAVGGPSGASVGGAAIGHSVDGGQNGGMSATELHNGCMRPLTHRHTQVAFAFVVSNATTKMTMKRKIPIVLMVTVPPINKMYARAIRLLRYHLRHVGICIAVGGYHRLFQAQDEKNCDQRVASLCGYQKRRTAIPKTAQSALWPKAREFRCRCVDRANGKLGKYNRKGRAAALLAAQDFVKLQMKVGKHFESGGHDEPSWKPAH